MTVTTIANTSVFNKRDIGRDACHEGDVTPPALGQCPRMLHTPSGAKAKARALLAAIRTLLAIEQTQRPATPDERQVLLRFPGCGPVALRIFPDPVTGRYHDATWQTLGEELRTLLSPEDYASARRTTFTAFYTSPVVIRAMHAALTHLGVPIPQLRHNNANARRPHAPGRAPGSDRPGTRLWHRAFPGPCS